MSITISKRTFSKTKGRGRVIRIKDQTYERLQTIKAYTGRKITEIVEIAIQEVRVGRSQK